MIYVTFVSEKIWYMVYGIYLTVLFSRFQRLATKIHKNFVRGQGMDIGHNLSIILCDLSLDGFKMSHSAQIYTLENRFRRLVS